jgi:hypothetical protein
VKENAVVRTANNRGVKDLSVQTRFVPLFLIAAMFFASVPSEVCECKEDRKDHKANGSSGGEFVPAHATPTLDRKEQEGEMLMWKP